tara:strand:- start:241 stop:423 length:183 start_codon:yes stop_codon:yes gene_type:complete
VRVEEYLKDSKIVVYRLFDTESENIDLLKSDPAVDSLIDRRMHYFSIPPEKEYIELKVYL